MSNDPLYAEKVLDSIKKDLTIENIQQLMFKYKQQADEWYPNIRFEENPNTESITFILVIGDQNDPVNCMSHTYTISKKDIVYYAEGNSLVEELSSTFAPIYEGLLRTKFRQAIKGLPENIKMQEKHK